MTDREFAIHYARVMLAEASRRRHQPAFYWWLIRAAQRSRRDAGHAVRQRGLFA